MANATRNRPARIKSVTDKKTGKKFRVITTSTEQKLTIDIDGWATVIIQNHHEDGVLRIDTASYILGLAQDKIRNGDF